MRRACALALSALVVLLALVNLHVAGTPTVAAICRCAFSIAAVTVVFFARTHIVKRAVVAALLEAGGGIAAFGLVDAPFIERHKTQIGAYAASFYERFER